MERKNQREGDSQIEVGETGQKAREGTQKKEDKVYSEVYHKKE